MVKTYTLLAACGLALLLSGCGDDETVASKRFYLESSASGITGDIGKTLTLPQSGLSYNVRGEPIFTEADITNVQLARVASGDYALLFHLNEPAARKLYRLSVADKGKVIIFEYGGKPLGARQLDGPISDGRYFTFVEMPYPELEQLVLEMQGETKVMNEKLREARF